MTSTIKRAAIGVLGTAVAVVVFAGCASTASTNSGSPGTASAKASSKTTVSKGLGTKDASGDVRLAKTWVKDPVLGILSTRVTVTNHSHKRSNYIIDLTLASPNGSTQFDTTTVLVNNLEPGQTNVQKAEFFSAPDALPKTAVVTVTSVQRNESF
jgi:hypothetical protein